MMEFGKRRKRKSGGSHGRKTAFRAAAKACKGKKIRAFRACMKAKLKK